MKSSLLAFLGAVSPTLAAIHGFNYASQGQTYDSFSSQFKTAASLAGGPDFNSARLYTMIQDGTTNTPIQAIQAAIDTNTTLLLGLWASETQDGFNNELSALKSAIQQYGSAFADLVVGISVGSEDLYRISPTGIAADSGIGQSPDVLVSYIGQVRSVIQGSPLSSTPVGHVDTWNVYVNGTNNPVIAACDFLGLDEYPYFQTTDSNGISNAQSLFFQALSAVQGVSQGKPIWITESGWPVSGPTAGQGVPSIQNAEEYWQDVFCSLETQNINTWWYILNDAGASPSFGLSDNGQPLYNLTCNPSKQSGSSSIGSTSAQFSSSTQTASVSGNPASATTTGDSVSGTISPTASKTGSSTSSQSTGAASRTQTTFAGLALVAIIAALAL